MISEARSKGICIHITTYKSEDQCQKRNMEDNAIKKCCNKAHNKYVCSICLNRKSEDRNCECCKKVPKNCPICQKNREWSGKTKERERNGAEKDSVCTSFASKNKITDYRVIDISGTVRDKSRDCNGNKQDRLQAETEQGKTRDPNVKTVQTSDTNVAQGLTLLNEVLTVFQNKKVDINKEKVKSGLLKDVAVSTVDKIEETNRKDKPRLTVSTFQYSIDDKKSVIENGKFTVVNCTQPIYLRKNLSIDLPKHKSSSIPQMKLEELKYSLKEKSRSKDAIEEVNRMFATVRKASRNIENSNRPVVRNGPRVLPLVITNHSGNVKKNFGNNHNEIHSCKCCQTCMSSGDSFMRTECSHDVNKEKCDKCIYMLCCHYENPHKQQAGVLFCEHCRDLNEEQCCQSNVDDV